MFKGFFYKKELTSLALVVIVLLPLYYLVVKVLEKKRGQKTFNITILLLYLAGVIYLTLLCKHPRSERLINLKPFWSYGFFFHADYQWQIYMNILLFIPLGYLMNVVSNKITVMRTILFALIISSIIEVNQYFLRLGLCEFDDVFHNTLGAVIGYVYFKVTERIVNSIIKNEHCN